MEALDSSNESSKDKCFDYIYEDLEEDIYRRTNVEDSLMLSNRQEACQLKKTNLDPEIRQLNSVKPQNEILSHDETREVQHEIEENFLQVQKENDLLRQRISELFKTTKVEIERKDRHINELTRKLDDLLLKRNRPLEQTENEFYNRRKVRNSSPSRREIDPNCHLERQVFIRETQKYSRLTENSEVFDDFGNEMNEEHHTQKYSSRSEIHVHPMEILENPVTSTVESQNKEIQVSHPNLFSKRMHERRKKINEGKIHNEIPKTSDTSLEHEKPRACEPNFSKVLNEKPSGSEISKPKLTDPNDICLLFKTVDDTLEDPRLNRAPNIEPIPYERESNYLNIARNEAQESSTETLHSVPGNAVVKEDQAFLQRKRNNVLYDSILSEKLKGTSIVNKGKPIIVSIARDALKHIPKSEENAPLLQRGDNKEILTNTPQMKTLSVEKQSAILSTLKIPRKSNEHVRDTRDILSDLHNEKQGSLRSTMEKEMGPKCDEILKDCEADLLQASTKKEPPPRRESYSNNRPDQIDEDNDSRNKYSERSRSRKRGERSPEIKKRQRSRSKSRHELRKDRYMSRERRDKHESRAPDKRERGRSRDICAKSAVNRSKSKYDQNSRIRELREEHKSRDGSRSRDRTVYRSKDRRDKSRNERDKRHRSRSSDRRDRSKSRNRNKCVKDPIEKLKSVESRSRSSSKEGRKIDGREKQAVKISFDEYKKNQAEKSTSKQKPVKEAILKDKDDIDRSKSKDHLKIKKSNSLKSKEVTSSKSRNKDGPSQSRKSSNFKKKLEVEEMVENLYKSHDDIDNVLSCEVENSIDQVLALYNKDLEVVSDDELGIHSNAKLLEDKPPEDLLAIKERLLAQLTNDSSLEEGEIADGDSQMGFEIKNKIAKVDTVEETQKNREKSVRSKVEKKYVEPSDDTEQKHVSSEMTDGTNVTVASDKAREGTVIENKLLEEPKFKEYFCESDTQMEIAQERVFNGSDNEVKKRGTESKINIISHVVFRSDENVHNSDTHIISEINDNFTQRNNENKNVAHMETSIKLSPNKSFQIESRKGKIVESSNEPIKERNIPSLDRHPERHVDSPNSSANRSFDVSNSSLNDSNSERAKKRIKPILIGPATSQLVKKSQKSDENTKITVKGCNEPKTMKSPKLVAAMIPLDDKLFSEFDSLVKVQAEISSVSDKEENSKVEKNNQIEDTERKLDPEKELHNNISKINLTDQRKPSVSSSESEIEIKKIPKKLPIRKIRPVLSMESSKETIPPKITSPVDHKTEKKGPENNFKDNQGAKQLSSLENSENPKENVTNEKKKENRSKLSCKRKTTEKSEKANDIDKEKHSKSMKNKEGDNLDHAELTIKLIRSRNDSNNYEISTDDEKGLSERVPNPEQHLDLKDLAKNNQTQISLSKNCKVSRGKVMENLKKEILDNWIMSDSSASKSPEKLTNHQSTDRRIDEESVIERGNSVINRVPSRGEIMDVKLHKASNSEETDENHGEKRSSVPDFSTNITVDKRLIHSLENDESAKKLGNKHISKGKYMIRIQHTEDSLVKTGSQEADSDFEIDKEDFPDHSLKKKVLLSDSSSDFEEDSKNAAKTTEECLEKDKKAVDKKLNPEHVRKDCMPSIELNSPVKKTVRRSNASEVEARMINIFGEDITLDSSDTRMEDGKHFTEQNSGKLAAQTPLWKQMELSDDSSSDMSELTLSYDKVPGEQDQVEDQDAIDELNQKPNEDCAEHENKKTFDEILKEEYATAEKIDAMPRSCDDLSPGKISKILSEEIKLKNPLQMEKKEEKSKSKKRKAKNSPGKSNSKKSKTTFPAIRLHPVRKSPRTRKSDKKQVYKEESDCEDEIEENTNESNIEKQNKTTKKNNVIKPKLDPSKRKKPAVSRKRKISCSSDPDLNLSTQNVKKPENKTARKTEVENLKLDTPKRRKPAVETKEESRCVSSPEIAVAKVEETPLIRRRSSRSVTPGPEVAKVIKTSTDSTPISVNNISRRSNSGKSKRVRTKSEKILENTFEEDKEHSTKKSEACSSPLRTFENMLIEKQSTTPTPGSSTAIDVTTVALTHDGHIPNIPVLHIEDMSFAAHCDFQNKSLLNFVEAMNVSNSNFHLLKESNCVEGKVAEQPNLLTFTNYLSSSNISTSTPVKQTKTQRCISFENCENQNLQGSASKNSSNENELNSVNNVNTRMPTLLTNTSNTESQKGQTSSSVNTQNSLTKSDLEVSGNSDYNCSSAERKNKVINYTLGVGIRRSRTRRPVVEFVD